MANEWTLVLLLSIASLSQIVHCYIDGLNSSTCIDVYGAGNMNLSKSEFNECPYANDYYEADNQIDWTLYEVVLDLENEKCFEYRYYYFDTLLLPNDYIIIARRADENFNDGKGGYITLTIWDNNTNLIANQYNVTDEVYKLPF